MSKFESYATKYKTIRMERRNGILQMTLHTNGGSLRWGFLPHGELPEAFYDVSSDYDNRVVIITGTGTEFSGPRANPGTSSFPSRPSIERIDRIHWEGRHLLMKLLDIEVPVISAINGPAWRHSEIPLLVRHRARRRYRAVPGFGALPLRRGPGRRHAHCLPAALGHEPGPLFPVDRADAQRPEGPRPRPRGRGPAAGQAPGAGLGTGGGPGPPADPAVAVHAPPADRGAAPADA